MSKFDYPRGTKDNIEFKWHRKVAEDALGKSLPKKAQIHHRHKHDGTYESGRRYNLPSNLIICEDQGYHMLIHAREEAYRATGDPNKRKCKMCHKYDRLENMVVRHDNRKITYISAYAHKACRAEYERNRRNNQSS
jgi:hypothetical protein